MFRVDVTLEMRTAAQSKDDQTHCQIVFYSRNGKRGKGQDRGETERERERERGRECELWEVADVASVVNRPLQNTHVKINKMVSIWTNCH